VTAAQAYLRAAICYHYGKHLFGAHAEEPMERGSIPFENVQLVA
jgi:hypothetical protein